MVRIHNLLLYGFRSGFATIVFICYNFRMEPWEKETADTLQKAEAAQAPEESALTDTAFMREKIKQRPVNRSKLLRRTVMTVSLAVLFGVVACVTFLLLSPVINRVLNPEPVQEPLPVILPEEHTEEVAPEDLIADDTELQKENDQEVIAVIDDYVFDVSDYNEMYASLRSIAQDASRSVVTVTAQQSGTDFSGESFETGHSVTGLIIADNSYALLVVTDETMLQNAEEINVTFFDGTDAEAALLQRDTGTGLCVLSVPHTALPENALERYPCATLGASASTQITGSPAIALGAPAGYAGSVMFGMVTGNARTLALPDANYHLLTTNLVGTPASSGVLVNTSGYVTGIFTPALTSRVSSDNAGLIVAYGISAVRGLMEQLSNNDERALLGIYGADVPQKVRERESIPQGAYVTRLEMDSPAMNAGIQSGDIITALDETEVTSFSSLSPVLRAFAPDDTVTVTLMRSGPDGYSEMQLEAQLAAAP